MSGWNFGEIVGSGGFGTIRKVTDNLGVEYVAKIARKNDGDSLRKEYLLLVDLGDNEGIPRVYERTKYESCDTFIMEMLGTSLYDQFNTFKRKFTEKTILLVAIQLLHRIEYVHSKHIIHRDVKPENFLIGLKTLHRENIIYITEHIQFREKVATVGTCHFASIHTHMGAEQSRRDDLESLGYTLVYFLKGSLPWQKVKGLTKKDLWETVGNMKRFTTLTELCENCPTEFSTYSAYVRALAFSENPDYNHLRSLFKNVLDRRGYADDGHFDWCNKSYKFPKYSFFFYKIAVLL